MYYFDVVFMPNNYFVILSRAKDLLLNCANAQYTPGNRCFVPQHDKPSYICYSLKINMLKYVKNC
jgi:hypothetical protein